MRKKIKSLNKSMWIYQAKRDSL